MKAVKKVLLKMICPTCGARVPDMIGDEGTPEPATSIYPCSDCENPEKAESERRAWAEAREKTLTLAARGELLDASGNTIPAITVIQRAPGIYEKHVYTLGADGKLEEVGAGNG